MIRKLIMSMVVMSSCMTTIAQSLTEGFYRIQNFASGKYLYIRDCTGEVSTLGADMGAIELWAGLDNAISDPSSVVFFDNVQGAWDITSQGTGVHDLTGMYMNIINAGGHYQVYASGQYLYEIGESSVYPGMGIIGAKTNGEMAGKSQYRLWDIPVVDSNSDNYFGFKPTITVGSKYYTTFFADFAYTPKSANTKTWYVSQVDKSNGIAVIKEVTGTVARSQAVIVECASDNTANNKVDLTTEAGNEATSNLLKGVFFSCGRRSGKNHPGTPAVVPFNAQTMRVLDVDTNGKLSFVNASDKLVAERYNGQNGVLCIPHNTAYLEVDSDCPATLQVMTEAEYQELIASQTTYTLTYKVDNEVYKTYTLHVGDVITPEPEPAAREGYTFSGWSEIPETMPAHDVTVTGNFTINTYTLTYKVDGEVYKTVQYAYGASITAEPIPAAREGYTFSGWSTIPATMPAHDVTVTGNFTINTYTLTYKVDGEVYKTVQYAYGASISAEPEPAAKEGYSFSGWSEIPETMPAHDVTVTGSWSINSYTITYRYNGEVIKETTLEYKQIIPKYTYQPEDTEEMTYRFVEWQENGVTFKTLFMPARDVLLDAVVEETPTASIEAPMSISEAVIYDILGNRVSNMKKGCIYIVNGKKYFNK